MDGRSVAKLINGLCKRGVRRVVAFLPVLTVVSITKNRGAKMKLLIVSMKKKARRFISIFGARGLFRLIVSQLTVVVTTPYRLVQFLLELRVLINGKWGLYCGFSPVFGLLSLFYWTQALNIEKYGRGGTSPCIGFGKFRLSKWFHLPLLSHYLYWRMSNVLVIGSLLIYVLTFLFWIPRSETFPLHITLIAALVSSTYYFNLVNQNYNVLGWAFFPIGVFGVLTGDWLLTSVAWLLVSMGSFTAMVFGTAISLLGMVYFKSPLLLVSALPASIKFLLVLFKSENVFVELSNLLKFLGAKRKTAKYVRTKGLSFSNLYLVSLYTFYFCLSIYQNGIVFTNLLLLIFIFIFFFNATGILRFADSQSIIITIFTISAILAIEHFNFFLFIAFVALANPIPLFLDFKTKCLDIVPAARPFFVGRILESVERFFSPVERGSKVLVVFNDPGEKYGEIFDGYRNILSAFKYIGTKKGVLVFPDWYVVAETNYQGAKEYWGRSRVEVEKNVAEFNCDFIVLYETESQPVSIKPLGMSVLAKLDWKTLDLGNREHGLNEYVEVPIFYLVKNNRENKN